jgi:hypothetical protein
MSSRHDGPGLQGSPESIRETDDALEVAVRLRNPLDRAVHYVADVRGMIFDQATRHVTVQLSDRGRELPPGGIAMAPRFRTIDPQSEVIATFRLPKTIVKLADSPSPIGDLVFEEHPVAGADAIHLEIGWADTPYYEDPRDASRGRNSVAAWEQDTVRVTVER